MIPKLTYFSSVVRGLVRDRRVLPRRGLVLDRHAPLNRCGLVPDCQAQYLLRGLVPDRHATYLLRGLVLDRHASRDPALPVSYLPQDIRPSCLPPTPSSTASLLPFNASVVASAELFHDDQASIPKF